MQEREFAPTRLTWWRPPPVPFDLNGPADVPFEPFGADILDQPLLTVLTAIAERHPNAAVLSDGSRTLDYASLRREIIRLACRVAHRVPAGSAVGVLVADGIDLAVAMLAAIVSGRVCVVISVEYPAERIGAILTGAQACSVLVHPHGPRITLPVGTATIMMDALGDATDTDLPTDALSHTTNSQQPALVIYTSGSTGQPKGIVRSQRQVLGLGWQQVRRFHLNNSDRVLSPYTLTTGGGVVGLMMTLLAGAAFHPMNLAAEGARAILDRARQERVTLLTGTPTLLRMLFALNGGGDAFASLRALYTTGEQLLAADIKAWRSVLRPDCAISFTYGMSEGGGLAGWFPPRDWSGPARLPMGYPNPDYEYAIDTPSDQTSAVGREGVLWVRSPLLSLGEWQSGSCVPGRLMAMPENPEMAVLCTGDVVRRRDDGLLEFVQRADTQVKIRGNRVEPAELENLLLQSPDVAEAAVLTRGSGDDAVLVAFVVASRGGDALRGGDESRDGDALRDGDASRGGDGLRGGDALRDALLQRARNALPAYMQPARLTIVDRLPRTSTGKVDLRALEAAGASAEPRALPNWWQWLRGHRGA